MRYWVDDYLPTPSNSSFCNAPKGLSSQAKPWVTKGARAITLGLRPTEVPQMLPATKAALAKLFSSFTYINRRL